MVASAGRSISILYVKKLTTWYFTFHRNCLLLNNSVMVHMLIGNFIFKRPTYLDKNFDM